MDTSTTELIACLEQECLQLLNDKRNRSQSVRYIVRTNALAARVESLLEDERTRPFAIELGLKVNKLVPKYMGKYYSKSAG
jgi:hypothetical protein